MLDWLFHPVDTAIKWAKSGEDFVVDEGAALAKKAIDVAAPFIRPLVSDTDSSPSPSAAPDGTGASPPAAKSESIVSRIARYVGIGQTPPSGTDGGSPADPGTQSPPDAPAVTGGGTSRLGKIWKGVKRLASTLTGGLIGGDSSDGDSGENSGFFGGMLGGLLKFAAIAAVVMAAASVSPLLGLVVGALALFGMFSEGGGLMGDIMSGMASFGKSLLGFGDDGTAPARAATSIKSGASHAVQSVEQSASNVFNDFKRLPDKHQHLIENARQYVAIHMDNTLDWLKNWGATPLDRAMVSQESQGHPDAVSKAGAYGLMQLMPETAKDLEKARGLPPGASKDPKINFKLGHDYQQAMLARYNGDLVRGLAAYNAGGGTVDNAMKKYGDDWYSNLPPETRDYVPKVLARLEKIENADRAREAPQDTQDSGVRVASVDRPLPTPGQSNGQSIAPA